MSNPASKTKQKDKNLNQLALDLLQRANASEWAILKAEEYQEKFDLTNGAMQVVAAMKWYERWGGGYKRLVKQYLIQLSEVDQAYRKKEKELMEKLQKEME